jgi:hypothetical protein
MSTRETRLQKQKDDIDELRVSQLQGKEKKVKANQTVDLNAFKPEIQEKYKSYEIRDLETDFYHVLLIKKENNPRTKTYDQIDRVVVVPQLQFQAKQKRKAWIDFDSVIVLHDPTKKATTKKQTKTSE